MKVTAAAALVEVIVSLKVAAAVNLIASVVVVVVLKGLANVTDS